MAKLNALPVRTHFGQLAPIGVDSGVTERGGMIAVAEMQLYEQEYRSPIPSPTEYPVISPKTPSFSRPKVTFVFDSKMKFCKVNDSFIIRLIPLKLRVCLLGPKKFTVA